MNRRILRAIGIALVALPVACTLAYSRQLGRRFGEAAVRDRLVQTLPPDGVDYWTDVRPILESRCVVCHGCYDAPCQLKLGSLAGIERGASKDRVYDAARILESAPTRLFEDAQSTQGWRQKGFFPVLNERAQSLEANREAGVMLQLLAHKRAHPLPIGGLLPDDIDVSLAADRECPTAEELPRHLRKHPHGGMPYGVPPLSDTEHTVLTTWLEQGAVHTAKPTLPKAVLAEVARWEGILNGDSFEAQLASRYIYEHLFLAHIYFGAGAGDQAPPFFELVRSTTPSGQPIDRIATRRPYDDPGVSRPYYRLRPVEESIVAKLHLPYLLDDARAQRWRELFFEADYKVTRLPSYDAEVASNPFKAFRDLPVGSRYRFMLDESEFTLMGFIKGAVCRGPIALNVIEDQFWVFFIDPDVDSKLQDAEFLYQKSDLLRMPAASGSNAPPLVTWVREASRQRKYIKAKGNLLRAEFAGGRGVTLDMLWDGDGHNPNAALTVFRHFDSATVVRGMVGAPPKTAWVLGYPILERIHYLLVAGFDVFGNVGHQLSTRTYMDFLRMEAEFGFLAFLPPDVRSKEHAFWYRETSQPINGEIMGEIGDLKIDTAIGYTTADPKRELYGMVRDRYAPVAENNYALAGSPASGEGSRARVQYLERLASLVGGPVSRLPQLAFLLVPDGPNGAVAFSLIHNEAHLNVSSPLAENKRLVPAEDTLTVARGLVGTYPNAFFIVPDARLAEFVDRIAALRSEADYAALMTAFGVRRTDSRFWATADEFHRLFRATSPITAGVFDFSRIENR